jgi:S-layer homology domain
MLILIHLSLKNFCRKKYIALYLMRVINNKIVTGYPDDTFRPEQPVARDEFAAIVRQAFSQPSERRIATGSVYKDISQGYWAESAGQRI